MIINVVISIHAPSRERRNIVKRDTRQSNFNPRSLAGATIFFFKEFKIIIRFQSTLPRGSDRVHHKQRGYLVVFQSTLPRGSDRLGADLSRE